MALSAWNEERIGAVGLPAAALLRYAVLLTGDRVDAEDLVQESLTKYLEHLRRRGSETLVRDEAAFLRKIIATTFISGHRRAKTWDRLLPLLFNRGVDADVQDRIAARDQLARALRGLSARQRTAVVLRYYEDLGFTDVADTLGCSDATARSLVSRALRRLRIEIENGDQSCP